jgi:peptidoglycan/LPS O-acetylase OafA/YrhL
MAAGATPAAIVSQAGERRSAKVESLRALAALSVLAGHVVATTLALDAGAPGTPHLGLASRILYGGGFGVYVFFGLSGYLLFWPFARHYFGGGGSIDLGRYALNRAVRILPLYYVVVLVVLAAHGETGVGIWARFLTFTENFSSLTAGKLVGPAWSLVVEVHFYLLLPLIAFALARLTSGSRARAAALIGTLALGSLAVRIATIYDADPVDPLWRLNLPSTFLFFTSGMLVALLRLQWEVRRPDWLRGPLATGDAWLLASLPLWALVIVVNYELDALVWLATFLAVGALVLPLSQGPLPRALEWRPVAIVGIASYSLYLWHVPVLEAITNAGFSTTSVLALGAVAAPISIAVALISYKAIEAPVLQLRRQWAPASAKIEGRDATAPEPAVPALSSATAPPDQA